MWVDILTKPKQGKAFRRDRAKLMNCPIDWQEPGVTCSEEVKSKDKPKFAGPTRAAFKDISNARTMPIRAVNA